MSLKDILTICLALILVVGIFALPYDFDLSIGNTVLDKTPNDESSDTDTDDSGNENGGNSDSGGSSLPITGPHQDSVFCSQCNKDMPINDSSQVMCSSEDYGSIGIAYYSVYCVSCEIELESFSNYHEYSNKDGVCTAHGCGHECTHTFNSDAINYVIPYDDRYSMFDASTMTDGDSAVYEGVCTICQKTITD